MLETTLTLITINIEDSLVLLKQLLYDSQKFNGVDYEKTHHSTLPHLLCDRSHFEGGEGLAC